MNYCVVSGSRLDSGGSSGGQRDWQRGEDEEPQSDKTHGRASFCLAVQGYTETSELGVEALSENSIDDKANTHEPYALCMALNPHNTPVILSRCS